MTAPRNEVMETLGDCIAHAPSEQRERLAFALEKYAEKYGRTYRSMRSGAPFLRDLIDTIEEASDARIDMDLADAI
jgi:hypothetical protein